MGCTNAIDLVHIFTTVEFGFAYDLFFTFYSGHKLGKRPFAIVPAEIDSNCYLNIMSSPYNSNYVEPYWSTSKQFALRDFYLLVREWCARMRLTYIYFLIAVTQGSHDFRFDMGRMGIRAGKLTSPEFFDKEVLVLLLRNM